MSLTNLLKKLLIEYKIKPRKRFGQSFLVDENLMKRMINYANLKEDDVVLDIGAGFGFLTELLAEKVKKVIAIEIDPKLVKFLRKKFAHTNRVEIFQGDFLKLSFKGYYNKVVSSPPYTRISDILFKLLRENFEVAVLLLQKEFALRLTAKPGEESYGRLTVMTYVQAEVELLDEVLSSAFYPQPEVSSMLVRIKPKKEPPFKIHDWNMFEETVRFLFTQKNRKLRNALQTFSKQESFKWLSKPFEGIPYLEKRVFTLKPEEICEISNIIYTQKNRNIKFSEVNS
ncbi:ribosomal RNA small subunit methyltransferase A [Candidatus Bathyarchaeota archaeon]|nr:MAG: ribosomal RNA small subunit methyltransferase A [Candidatus Bathyarchaeota archaeon]